MSQCCTKLPRHWLDLFVKKIFGQDMFMFAKMII